MFKNVSLRTTHDGTPQLLGPDGRPIAAFAIFANEYKNKRNTQKAYCRHLAEFLDYGFEAAWILSRDSLLKKSEIIQIIEGYGDYLLYGDKAKSEIAVLVSRTRPPGKNSHSSIGPKKAALLNFLQLSEQIRRETVELGKIFHPGVIVDDEPLLMGIDTRQLVRTSEVKALRANSMLAGVIAGGPKLIRRAKSTFWRSSSSSPYNKLRAFPYDKVMPLISALPSYRDKTFYSLLAASGARSHEGLQVLLSDIDVSAGTMRLVDPGTRSNHPTYLTLTPGQRDELVWKGRTSDFTLLIEPFASAFFENLQKYLETEYLAHGYDGFLFQFNAGKNRGLPYFLSAASSRLEIFAKAQRSVDVSLPEGTGPHSLRHMYGTYALNYFPRSDGGYGLPIAIVQQLLGHADIKSTYKYARYDEDLLRLEAENANRVIFEHGIPKSLLQLKYEALQSELDKVRAQIDAQEAVYA